MGDEGAFNMGLEADAGDVVEGRVGAWDAWRLGVCEGARLKIGMLGASELKPRSWVVWEVQPW